MEPQLYVVSVGDKHYASGTIYTPDGIKPYSGVLDEFEQIFTLFPTFATVINCYNDEVCIRDRTDYFYYLTYRNEYELEKMLVFMNHASVQYLSYIPPDVIRKMDIHIEGAYITIGGANILQNVDCKIIGSIPATLTVTYGYIAINGVKIGVRDESGDYAVCGQIINLDNGVISHLEYLLACYFLEHYKGTPTWSEVLKTWCGIRTSLKT
jgi:hypothetical protein